MRLLRFAPSVLLVAVAVAVALLAADVRGWQRTLSVEDTRAGTVWPASPRLPGDPAAALLGVADDVRARKAIRAFQQVVGVHARLDDAQPVTAARAEAEAELALVARGTGPRASQAATLLGVLAFSDASRGGGGGSQVDTALAELDAAIRADPGNSVAKYDLELLLRTLVAHGSRTGTNGGSGTGGKGRNGAGSGTPGRGY
jgi:hypothetical protein